MNRSRIVILLILTVSVFAGYRYLHRPPPRWNVLLIVLDTLRADRIGMNGSDGKPLTENLNSFFADSLKFTRAISNSNWTLPSHMSMFTSLYPSHHGVQNVSYPPFLELYKYEHRNIEGWAEGVNVLKPAMKTMTEYLHEAGYLTAWFAHSRDWYLDVSMGFHRGFDQIHPFGLDSEAGTKIAESWLKENHNRRFFAFMHTKLPHAPYTILGNQLRGELKIEANAPAAEKASEDQMIEAIKEGLKQKPRPYSVLLTTLVWAELCYFKKGTLHQPFKLQSLYCHEIGTLNSYEQLEAYYNANVKLADRYFGKIIATLKETGLYDNTLIIVTADHGEGFGLHSTLEHGSSLYNEVLNVPLAIRVPGQKPGISDRLVELVDLLPTVLKFTGISVAHKIDGRDIFNTAAPDFAFSDSRDNRARQSVSLQGTRWKLINAVDNEIELYDVQSDPKELKNLAGQNSDLVKNMQLEIERRRVPW